MNNNYQPNFSDPRVQSRIKLALGFACGVISETKSHPWSTRYIDKYFGISSNPLSKYLREKLLICTDEFFRFNIPGERGICKKYILNKEGVRFLRDSLKLSNTQIYPIVLQVAQTGHKQELETGNFNYSDKNHRLHHPLQRYRRSYRTEILADSGYLHDYDIECCAPTLIHQYAQHLGMDEYLFALRRYLDNRTVIRKELAFKLELPEHTVKEIINALFCGAIISNNSKSDIYAILNGDRARIEYLKQDEYINELKRDIKTCWQAITPHLPRRRNAKTNRLIKITCRQKWNVYFELERLVLNSIRNYLKEKSNRSFLIHDGWTCERAVDLDDLRDYVKNSVGYHLRFEHTEIKQHTNLPYCITSSS